MNKGSVRSIWAVLIGIVLSVSLASCGGGGGSGSGAGSPAGGTEVIQPIVSSGKVTLPPSVSPSNLTVVSGIDSQPVQADGSFSITLNKDNSQLVTAVNPESNPVLLGITVNAQPGSSISLDMHSTAEALIYLSPGIAQDDTADAQTVMGYIKELPETTALANLLETKLAADPNVLGSDIADLEINAALSTALQALIAKIQQEGGIQKPAAFKIISTTPTSASGIEFTYDTATQELEGRNYKKRYVSIWETNPEIKHLFSVNSISSIGMLTDSILNLEVTTYTRNTSLLASSNNELTLKVYGLGFSDAINTANRMTSDDWVRLSLPAAESAVFDIAAPVIGTVLGINNLSGKASNTFAQYASAVSLVLQGGDLGVKLAGGDLKGTVITLIKSSVSVLTENNYALLKAILIECGADAVQQAAINSIFFWTRLVFSVANLSDVILSATSLTTTKLVETFTIIPSELADGIPPQAPTGVSATAGNNQVTVRWNAVLNATSYNLYMASSSGVTKTNYNILPDGMRHTGVASPYLKTGLTNGKTYHFVVTAVNANEESSESGEVSAMPATVTENKKWGTPTLIETKAWAAHNPHSSMNANGEVMAVWEQDGIWANRYVPGIGWGTAVRIDDSRFSSPSDPRVTIDANGNATAVWRQWYGSAQSIWTNRYVAGTGWSTATVIENSSAPAHFSPPVVAADSTGNVIAVWSQWDGSNYSLWSNRFTPGVGWTTPVLVETSTGTARDPHIMFDPNGNAIVVWMQDGILANRHVAGQGWGTPTQISPSLFSSSAVFPQVALDGSGNAIAVWDQRDSDGWESIWANRYVIGTGWGSASLLETMTGSFFRPSIAMDRDGNAMVVWGGVSVFANRYTVGSGWGIATRIGTGTIYGPTVAMDQSGNAIAAWSATIDRKVYANSYGAGNGWGTAVVISTSTSSSGHVRIKMDGSGRAVAVWGEGNDIFSNRFE